LRKIIKIALIIAMAKHAFHSTPIKNKDKHIEARCSRARRTIQTLIK